MKSPKRFLLFGAWLVLAFVSAPERLTAQPPATASSHPFWKIQGKTNAVYLLGSIHFCTGEFYPLAKPIEDAYQRSKVVVFEADPAELASAAMQKKLVADGMYPAGETLSQHVSKETYSAVKVRLEAINGQGAALDQFKPWLAAVSLVTLEMQKLGFDPEQDIDKHFHRRAQSDKKEIVPLETVESQIGLLTSLSKEEEELFLKATLRDIARFPKIAGDMVRSWKTGDLKKLQWLLLEVMKEYPALQQKLTTNRHRAWLPKIEKLLQEEKDAFVVVGLAHLVDEGSLVDLLNKKGIKVEQQ